MDDSIGGMGFAVIAILAFAGCPKALTATSASVRVEAAGGDVEGLIQRTRALLRKQDEAVWRAWTEGTPVDLRGTADEAAALYTPEALARIDEQLRRTGDPLDRRALEQLRVHFVGELLARAVERETQELAVAEAGLTFQHGERQHSIRELERVLARERNAVSRQQVKASASARVETLTPLLQARQKRVEAALSQLGYATRKRFAAALRRTDLDAIAANARRILEVTEPTFRNVLEQLAAQELRMPLERVRLRDLPRMFRSRDVDELFPKEALGARISATVRGLGADPAALTNLRVDDRDLPAKNPRALALAIEVPADVRISVKPLPGLRAHSAYLHEMGYALHAAFTREPRFALAKLGGGSIAEAWSLLFELLVEDPVWLEQQARLTGERRDHYLAASAAWDLHLLRRAAGYVLYEQALDAGAADPKAAFRDAMHRAFLVPIEEVDTVRWFLEQEEFFASAARIEAEVLAHQIQGQLKARFGPAWWEKREAGDYLRALWARGNALEARELARELGESRLSPDALLLRLMNALKVPIASRARRSGSARRPLLGAGGGQGYEEGARARVAALHPELAAHALRELPRHPKAHAGSLGVAGEALESLEEHRLLGLRDARPLVAQPEEDAFTLVPHPQREQTRHRVFRGVGEQVGENLPDAIRVGERPWLRVALE
jgi:hypothetical protein